MNERCRRSEKQYIVQERMAILKRHLEDRMAVSDLYDENDMYSNVHCCWQHQFFKRKAAIFLRGSLFASHNDCNVSRLPHKKGWHAKMHFWLKSKSIIFGVNKRFLVKVGRVRAEVREALKGLSAKVPIEL